MSVITGGKVRLYINNHIYPVAQSVSMEMVTGAYEIYGIGSPYPQEIAMGGQRSAKGSVKGVMIRGADGIQSANIIGLFSDAAANNYISLRLEDRQSGLTIWNINKAQCSQVSMSVAAKGVLSISFSFSGQIVYFALDLS